MSLSPVNDKNEEICTKREGEKGDLIIDVDVHVFTEGVSFREACGAVLHQVESLQRSE